ncbi:Glyoxalase/Bleomycin resistance protein/Dihydroxybiphenyl dioxygenase [Dichotomopilus funicola]|uniref:Glyoxalase/Bleomycin resistance protein/Dihydroxybiphenyl dioxygenase n=1 Tax=Dichotomopilus funicola TaxID=1934379 RepID=A0AAN6V9N9_9PEZI|nr:Glyoxalase/Bleomycin resistance protein/Dihydroxybiphenyl dioxygenase [Dichotomopilus funicola]
MTSHPHNPLGHISIGVRDYTVSKAFYTAVLEPLGLRLVFDSEEPASTTLSKPKPTSQTATNTTQTNRVRTLGYGRDPQHELLNIFEFGEAASPPGPGFHLALTAPSRMAVVEFHERAMAAGGEDNGLPGVRKHYGANYFAAFVVDPDGWRLEVVCKDGE